VLWDRRSPHLDSRINACPLSAYKKQDPPPTRVKPIPFPIIAQITALCHRANTPAANAIADMLLLGFFFLLRHICIHRAPLTTPLYSYFDTRWNRIDTTSLTQQLRHAITAMGATYGIAATDISISSLRSSGAMALLCTKVDMDMIRLLSRWRSNKMLRYLHVQTFPLVAPLAAQMLQHGQFSHLANQPLMGNGGAARTIQN
jgi:hypothetical protein